MPVLSLPPPRLSHPSPPCRAGRRESTSISTLSPPTDVCFSSFCSSLSLSFFLCLLISLCLSVSLLRFPPLTTLLCALPIALRCSFVSFFFLFFFSQSPSCSIATDMSPYPSARSLLMYFLVSFFLTLLGPSCRSLGFYTALISLHSLFIFLVPSFTLSPMIRLAGRCRLSGNQTVWYPCRACSTLRSCSLDFSSRYHPLLALLPCLFSGYYAVAPSCQC